jgi:hypothetical protein
MTSRDFAFWLQGYFEISQPQTINEREVELIKKHLNLVFKHEIDPSMGDQNHQDELNKIHFDGEYNVPPAETPHIRPTEHNVVLRC